MKKRMRDLRDPSAMGDQYLRARSEGVPIEYAVAIPCDDYDHGESTVQSTVTQYRKELEDEVSVGSVSAQHALNRLNGHNE